MKRRYITLVSDNIKTLTNRTILVAGAVLMVIAAPLAMAEKAYARDFDAEINALQGEINQYKSQANALQQQIGSLQNAVAGLENQKNIIQTQIDLNEAKLAQLQQQIKDTEDEIAASKDALGTTLASIYIDDKISPLEMLASSQNIGDYVDKQEYRSSVQDQLAKSIQTIKELKAKLESDKKNVTAVLDDQKTQRNSLVANQQAQQSLLDQTKGQESQYQALIGSTQQKLRAVAEQQRAAIARLTNNGRNTSGSVGSFEFRNYSGNMGCGGGGYPYCGSQDSYADPWALYNRECVSYAAWAAVNRFGKHLLPFGGAGNAYQWPSTTTSDSWNRQGVGADVNNTPEVGSVAITPQQAYTPLGHAMVVEEILDGGWVHVSQYNFAGTGEYSTMDLKVSSAVYVHFR